MSLRGLVAAGSLLLLAQATPAQASLALAELWLVQLRSRDVAVRQRAYDQLVQVGPALLPRLIDLLSEPDDGNFAELPAQGEWNRPSLGPEATLEERLLREFDHCIATAQSGLFERSEWIESSADLAVGRQPREVLASLVGQQGAAAQPAVPVLLRLFASADQGLAAQCFWSLLRPGLQVVSLVPELLEQARLAEQSRATVRAVVRLLHLLGRLDAQAPGSTAALMVPFLASEGALTAAETELVRLDRVAIPAVRARLEEAKGAERLACMAVLTHVVEADALVALLQQGLADPDPAVHGHAAAALVVLAGRGSLPAAAADPLVARFVSQVRVGQTEPVEFLALGALGPRAASAAPAVVAGLTAPLFEVRQGAVLALTRLGPAGRAAVPLLLKLVREEWGGSGLGPHALAALASVAPPPESAPELGAALVEVWGRIPVDPRDPLRPPEAQAVVRTLGRVPAPQAAARQILDDAEASGDWRLRGLSYAARWRIEGASRDARLAELVQDLEAPVSSDRRAAALALQDLGREAGAAAAVAHAALERETHLETRAVLAAALNAMR